MTESPAEPVEAPEQVYLDAWKAEADARANRPIDLPDDERDRIAAMWIDRGFRAAVEVAYRAGRRLLLEDLERPGSGLCDCVQEDGEPPTNPRTGAEMDHHCDCSAVGAVATLLGAYSSTVHAAQCGHGTELDEFYREPKEQGNA